VKRDRDDAIYDDLETEVTVTITYQCPFCGHQWNEHQKHKEYGLILKEELNR
jgi:hypothetical protein